MSEMDKEAEREKLRQQFEKEEENRKSTAHMSELLLKGATMTNKHCNNCGDPIFRYEGQHFCPTCRTPANADGSPAEVPADAQGTPEPDDAQPEPTQTEPVDSTQETPDETDDIPVSHDGPSGADTARPRIGHEESSPPTAASPVRGDVSKARDSLIATLTSLTQQAQATEDIGRARELLSAAKEAAEALDAVNALDK